MKTPYVVLFTGPQRGCENGGGVMFTNAETRTEALENIKRHPMIKKFDFRYFLAIQVSTLN